jgi:hypothetical protein
MSGPKHWLVLPVDPESEPFLAWGSVEADEYRRQSAVYRVEEYVRADQLAGAVGVLESIRDEAGAVCAAYEVCEHDSCQASYTAWALADDYLRGR